MKYNDEQGRTWKKDGDAILLISEPEIIRQKRSVKDIVFKKAEERRDILDELNQLDKVITRNEEEVMEFLEISTGFEIYQTKKEVIERKKELRQKLRDLQN